MRRHLGESAQRIPGHDTFDRRMLGEILSDSPYIITIKGNLHWFVATTRVQSVQMRRGAVSPSGAHAPGSLSRFWSLVIGAAAHGMEGSADGGHSLLTKRHNLFFSSVDRRVHEPR